VSAAPFSFGARLAELTTDEISDAIRSLLLGPKRVAVGDESVEQHPINELLEALQQAQGQQATEGGRTGLRFFQFVPPGGGGTP
jgi:hypothetical protein